MKVIIFGSRQLNPSTDLLHSIIISNNLNITEIISGGCRGIDQLGEQYAKMYNIPVMIIKPEWDKYGRAAGPIRNSKMVELAELGVCLWDGKSKGTLDTINKLQSKGKVVIIHQIS